MIGLSMEIPTPHLERLSKQTELDFALAHAVLKDKTYRRFYKTRDFKRELILDNSMHELGHPLPLEQLGKAARQVDASYVVAPDQLKQYEQNVRWFQETHAALGDEFGIAAVLCGETVEERNRFLDLTLGRADMLCLPFREPRFDWYQEHFHMINMYPRVHLLGVNTLRELDMFRISTTPWSNWTVDTSKPIKWAIRGKSISGIDSLRGCPVGSEALLWMTLTEEQLLLAEENILHLRQYLT